MTRRLAGARASRVLAALLAVYLLSGAAFALGEVSPTVWVCPDPAAPHGVTTGSTKKSPLCEPSASVGERVVTFAAITVLWGPLLVAKGLANRSESRAAGGTSGG